LHNKKKAKLKAQVDHLNGFYILDANKPKVPVDHKSGFKKEVCDFMKDSHKRLAFYMKAAIVGEVLQDREFMDCIIFEEAMSIIIKFYHDTIFPNYKVLMTMD
jgi:hypothetical protein